MSGGGLRAIFLEQRPMLLRLLVARLGDAADAEDALQDMWLKIDGLAHGPIDQPAAFLYRVAANLATDRRIAGSRRVVRDDAWQVAQPGADEHPDAERMLVARDRLARVERSMAMMPDRMRIALRMFRFEQQSHRAIADALGISVSGVEKLLRRAYRQILAADGDDGAGEDGRHRLTDEGRRHGDG